MKLIHLFFTLLLLLLLPAWTYSEPRPEKLASITFIDVGEGDSILVQSGQEAALIDTGNLISGYRVSEYLEASSVKRLKAMIVTHPHLDHSGGAFLIAQAFKPEVFVDNGEPIARNSDDSYRWYDELRMSYSNYKALKSGDNVIIGKASLTVLWPPSPGLTPDWNTNSLVIKVNIGGFSALLMGDANLETENSLLKAGINIKASILKVGHHGARDAGSQAFLDAVGAKTSIVSVNRGNKRGYPDAEVIARLKQRGSTYLTSEVGNVKADILSDGSFSIVTQ